MSVGSIVGIIIFFTVFFTTFFLRRGGALQQVDSKTFLANTSKPLTVIGLFLILGGFFGVYMGVTGADTNPWLSAITMLIFGVLFLVVGLGSQKKH